MNRALKIGGIGCGGLIALVILISVIVAVVGSKSSSPTKSTTTPTTNAQTTTAATTGQTNTTGSASSCLHVSKATVQAIANGLDNRRIALRYDAVAVKLSHTKDLYAVTGRIVGPGMNVGGPTLATWITDSITSSPTVVWSGERLSAMFSQWGKAPGLYDEGDIILDQGCFPSGG